MRIQTNTTDRKALVKAIAEELHTEYRYLRTPTYAYEVGDFTVDRDGNIIGEDFTPLMGFLLRNGYITEDALAAQTEPADEPAEEEMPVEEAADETANEPADEPAEEHIDVPTDEEAEKDTPEEPSDDTPEETNSNTDSELLTSMLSVIDEQTITIPAPDITVEQLRNLTYILYSRQYILNLMTCGDTIQIPEALVQSLKNTLPDTPEHFSEFLDIYRRFGLKGFDFKDGQFSLTFPFYETEPTKWTAFAGLQGRILQMAWTATRVFPELMKPEEEAEKYTAHMWLQRMGYKGPEMKEQRNILLKHLHGYCAFSNGAKMQKHKDKYSAIRRERREAERAAALESAVETIVEAIAPTAEAKAPAVEPEKGVAVND